MRLLLTALALCCALTPAAAVAQAAKNTQAAVDGSTFNVAVDVGYVIIPFVVTGSDGKPVTTLRQRDVSLHVGGKRVQTDMFEHAADAPVSFTILLDASGSMELAGKFQSARVAIHSLLNNSRPGDDFALHVFSEGELREVVPFTRDRDAIRRAIADIKPYGKTAFYDALARMPDETILGQNGSRAIVLFTDALDNASSLSKQQVTEILQGVDVPVYAMGLRMGREAATEPDPSRREELTDLQTLEQIADISGGRVATGTSAGELIHAIRAMDRDLRSQYLLGFSPTGKGSVRFRPIEIRLARGLRNVRVRAGYRGTEPPVWTRGSSRGGSK